MNRVASAAAFELDPEVRPFVPTSVDARTVKVVERRAVTPRHWVRDLGRDQVRALAVDPLEARVSALKVVLNTASIFVVGLVAGLVLLATAPLLFGYQPVVVISGSMEPSIKMADVVVTAPSDGVGLDSGTVINFEVDGTTRLHRISEATEGGYRTSGDANPSPDTELVAPSQVRGVGTVVVPFVGLPRLWLTEGRWFHLGAAVLVVVASLYMSRARWLDDGLARLAIEVRP